MLWHEKNPRKHSKMGYCNANSDERTWGICSRYRIHKLCLSSITINFIVWLYFIFLTFSSFLSSSIYSFHFMNVLAESLNILFSSGALDHTYHIFLFSLFCCACFQIFKFPFLSLFILSIFFFH